VLLGQLAQSGQEVPAHLGRVGLQPVVLDHLQYRACPGHDHGIAPKCVEVELGGQGVGNLWRRDDGTDRQAVADALRHRHDIRRHAVILKPKVL